MARGWESKSVESQIEGAHESSTAKLQALRERDPNIEREKQNLLLSCAYIQQQLQASPNSKYTEALRKALEEIHVKLAKLAGNSSSAARP